MYRKVFITIVILSIAISCNARKNRVRRIVGGEPAEAPPVDDPVVFTRFGGKTARVQGVLDAPHYVFRGIRYAHAPVGKERFLRPRQYFLEGFVNATTYPPPCLQPVPGEENVIGDEDCLFLNVFTPTLPTGLEGLPVIVWIHGGGFRYGSASQYGVRHLVGKQVVVVTIQFRLGSLGFLSTGSKTLPGNAALWDMVLAVQWTRNYIGFFGGNPHRIVVMGHGTGASCAIMVALSNVAKGLTSAVVAMSGSSVSHFATDDKPKNTALEVADANGCPTASELTMVKCLQNLAPSAIVKVDSLIESQRLQTRGFLSGLAGRLGTAPCYEGRRDGRSLPPVSELEPLSDPQTSGSKIPLLTGITRDETKKACQNQFKTEILSKLKNTPDFLNKDLVKNLQKTLGLPNVGNSSSMGLLNLLDPKQFANYLQYHKNNFIEGIGKISEATSDALFNVPAFLTVDAWAKQKAPSFLYSFEHLGQQLKGYSFLKGLPLVGNRTQGDANKDAISHGDELAYLFDAQDFSGNLIGSQKNITEEDNKVRDFFTQMISDFARSGQLQIGKKNISPFSSDSNNYIKISPNPQMLKNFKYCETALWVGWVKRLQTNACSVLKALEALPGKITDLTGALSGKNDLSKIFSGEKSLTDALSGKKDLNVAPGGKNGLTEAVGQSNSNGFAGVLGGKSTLTNAFRGKNDITDSLGSSGQKSLIDVIGEKSGSSKQTPQNSIFGFGGFANSNTLGSTSQKSLINVIGENTRYNNPAPRNQGFGFGGRGLGF